MVRTRAGAHDRLVVEGLRDLLAEDVARHLHDGGAGPAVPELGKGAAEHVRDLGRARHRLARLGDRAEGGGRVEVGAHVGDVPCVPHRHDQDRDRLAERLRDPAEGVLRPRPVLHREDPDPVPRAQPRHRVRHVEPDPLLADDDGPDVRPRGVLEDVVHRVPDERVDSLALEDLGDRVGRFHACISWLFRLLRFARGGGAPACPPGAVLVPRRPSGLRSVRGRRSGRTSREGSPGPGPARPPRRSRTVRPRSIRR